MKSTNKFLLGALAAPLLFAPYANAGLSVAGLFDGHNNPTLLSDNSAELIFDRDGSGTVNVGDMTISIVGINTIEKSTVPGSQTLIGQGTVYNELTMLTATKIASAGAPFVNLQGIPMALYTAAPLDGTDVAWFDWSTGTIDDNGAAAGGNIYNFIAPVGLGAVANDGKLAGFLYEDGNVNYDRDSGIQTGITSASDGTARLRADIDPATDPLDVLAVIAPTIILPPGTPPPLTFIQGSDFFLNGTISAQNWSPLLFGPDIFGGNAGFSAPSGSSGWDLFDNADYTLNASAIPEPGTIILMGLGLVGLAGVARKKMDI